VVAERRGVILAGRQPEAFPHIASAAGRGLGRMEWKEVEEKLLEVAG
jgi:hypothetical protein